MELCSQLRDRLEAQLTRRDSCVWGAESAPASRFWLVFVALSIAAMLPIVVSVLPPLFDYPNHLARMRILADGGNDFVRPNWSALPNLAEDLIVPPLAGVVPIETAGKLFLIVIVVLTASGAATLNRALTGAWRWSSLSAFLFLYHRSFLWGFLNYDFGVGVAFWAAALWLALERCPALRLAVASIAALIGYFSHIEAFVCQALIIAGLEVLPGAGELLRRDWLAALRRAATTTAPWILPLGLFVTRWHPAGGGWSWSLAGLARKPDLLFSVFDNYSRPFDVGCFVLLLASLGFLIWRGSMGKNVDPLLVLVPRAVPALGLVLAAFLIVPAQLLSGSGVDHRLPPVLFLLLTASIVPRFGKFAGAIYGGASAVLMARLAVVLAVWFGSNRIYEADLAALDRLPEGTRVAVAYPPRAVNMIAVPLTHLPLMATVRRGAFVSTLFAFADQQPIELAPDAEALLSDSDPSFIWRALETGQGGRAVPLGFDYLVALDRAPIGFEAMPCLDPTGGTADFRLYRVEREACGDRR